MKALIKVASIVVLQMFLQNAMIETDKQPVAQTATETAAEASAETATAASQIDPNSFTRPVSRGALNSTRGSRKLWVPT